MTKNRIALIAIIAAAGVITATPKPQTAVKPQAPLNAEAQLATIKDYCVTCHNDRAKTANVTFENMTPASIAEHPDVYETVSYTHLRAHETPEHLVCSLLLEKK